MNPLIPMLAITGNPTNEQLEKMLTTYKTVGVDTVMLYPRSGLEIGYMSEDWRRLVAFVLATAKRLQMHVWLYDEFNWPSGSCKNTVIQEDPSFGAKRFVYENGAVQVEMMKAGAAERVFHPFDSDMLNPEAVRCFIRLTHEKYYAWFSEYFGNVICGIFTDEPSFIYTANSDGVYPYYDGICEDYTAVCGGDLKADICAFEQGDTTTHFPGEFRKLISKRFKSAFIDQISAWCRAHGLPLTGHTLDDEHPLLATRETGEWFSFIEQMDVPGVDEIPTRLCVKDEMLFSMIENVRYNGKPHAMAELFALGPCSMSFARRKQLLWYAAAHGVDHFFIAISHMDAKGNVRKPDFFDNFNYHNPDFDGIRLLAKEAEAVAAFAQKRTTAKVGIRVCYENYLAALCKREDGAVNTAFQDLIDALVAEQVTFRFLREGETAEMPFVFTLQGTTVVEETSGNTFADVADAAKSVAGGICVTDQNGNRMSDIRLKTYEDGTILVLDRSNEPKGKRACVLHTEQGDVPFTLESFGVQVFDRGDLTVSEQPQGEHIPFENPTVSPLSDGVFRPRFFKKDTDTFKVDASMTVQMHRRIYPDADGTVLLDGKAIVFDETCDALTTCFSHLYRTATVQLAAGEHTLTTDMNDLGYLPAVLLTGDFPFDNTFFGKCAVCGEMTLPVDAKTVILAMEDAQLYTTLLVDGEEIGAAAFAPYRFEIPARFFGKTVQLTLVFHSTLAPLFGDLAGWNEAGIFSTAWADTPKSAPEVLDAASLNIQGIWR